MRALIVDADLGHTSELDVRLRATGSSVLCVSGTTAASDALRSAGPFSVVAAGESLNNDEDGITFLEPLLAIRPSPALVLMSSHATANTRRIARIGDVAVIHKPVDARELLVASYAGRRRRHGLFGPVVALSLDSLLRILHSTRRSVRVCVGREGEIALVNGEIVHATNHDVKGEVALHSLLAIDDPSIETMASDHPPTSIEKDFHALLGHEPLSELIPIDAPDSDDDLDFDVATVAAQEPWDVLEVEELTVTESPNPVFPQTESTDDVSGEQLQSKRSNDESASSIETTTPDQEKLMSLERVLSEVQKTVPECVAVGVVEMQTGMLLGVRTVDSHPQEVLDLVAAATGDIFQGTNVSEIERMFKQARGVKDDGSHYFQEIIILSDNLIHVFQRGKRNEDLVMVSVCRGGANLGMVLTRSRKMLTQVETAA